MKILFFYFLFFSLSVFGEDLGLAPFDPDYENYMYSIYKKYHGRSLTREQWQGLTANRDVNTYSIQKGDNLWDISQLLFGNSNYWPKLWSINANITNPHRVHVNHLLQVVMGNENFAPRAVIRDGKTSQSNIDGQGGEERGGDTPFEGRNGEMGGEYFVGDNLENNCVQDYSLIIAREGRTSIYDQRIKCHIQKQKISQRRVEDLNEVHQFFERTGEKAPPKIGFQLPVKNIPASFPSIPLIHEETSDISISGGEYDTVASSVITNYVVDKKGDVNIVGSFYDKLGEIPIVTTDVILDLEVPADLGDVFTLIHPPIKIHSSSLAIRGPFGYEVIVQAVVEITKPVPNRSGFYFANVIKMYDDITENSKVIQGLPSNFDFWRAEEKKLGTSKAQIIGVAKGQSADTITKYSFVYLNKGSKDNINVGDVLYVQGHPNFHSSYKKDFFLPLGEVIIAHTSGSNSTAFVTDLNSLSFLGDYVEPHFTITSYADEAEDERYIEEEDSEGDDFSEDEEEDSEGDDFSEDEDTEEFLDNAGEGSEGDDFSEDEDTEEFLDNAGEGSDGEDFSIEEDTEEFLDNEEEGSERDSSFGDEEEDSEGGSSFEDEEEDSEGDDFFEDEEEGSEGDDFFGDEEEGSEGDDFSEEEDMGEQLDEEEIE